MRKERNAFFNESSYNSGYYFNPMMNPQLPNMEASSSFYMNQNMNQDPSTYNDIQTRLAKLERQVNRLEGRITKIENSPLTNINESTNIDSNSNMYMI